MTVKDPQRELVQQFTMTFYDAVSNGNCDLVKKYVESDSIIVSNFQMYISIAILKNHIKVVEYLVNLDQKLPLNFDSLLEDAYSKKKYAIYKCLLCSLAKRKRLNQMYRKLMSFEKMKQHETITQEGAFISFYGVASLMEYKQIYLPMLRPKIFPKKTLALKLVLKPTSLHIQFTHFY
jgi:hypothetical protein